MMVKPGSITRQSLAPKTLAIALCALGLVLAAGSLAIANISPRASFDDGLVDDLGHDIDEAALPMPVVGNELFIAPSNATDCAGRDSVIAEFLTHQAEIGGQTYEVRENRSQNLSDVWRDRTRVARTTVSGIVYHLFFDRHAQEWTADLVEFNQVGCAMSRTLLPGFALEELFTAVNDLARS